MPAYIHEAGKEPYRPVSALWMIADGPVLGATVATSEDAGASLLEAFEFAATKPMVGPAHLPSRVRVASSEIAAMLRERLPFQVEVLCAPTPEVDAVAESMRGYMQANSTGNAPSYLGGDVTPEHMGSLFHAAAQLYRARPWNVLPDDNSLLSLSCEALGMQQAVVSVVGQLGEAFGFSLLRSFAEFESYLDEAMKIDDGHRPRLPAHLVVQFERGSDVPVAIREEISRHRWEVAGPDGYPNIMGIDKNLIRRVPSREEVFRLEAVCRALVALIEGEPDLENVWRKGRVVQHVFSEKTAGGVFELVVRAPHEGQREEAAPSLDENSIHAEKRLRDGSLDERWFEKYRTRLMTEFAKSPEAASFEKICWADTMMEYAASYLDVTVAAMTPGHLRATLLGVFPEKLIVDASEAPAIVAELTAFFSFLKRAHRLVNMEACLRVLTPETTVLFSNAMADTTKFGLAKGVVMAGKAEGFDVSTAEGLQAWINESNARQEKIHGVSPPRRRSTPTRTPRQGATREKTPRTPRKKG
jgi:hypothetical protein